MPAPKEIIQLIERFDPTVSEATIRNEYINPFFEALGWDVYNKKGYAEAYKEVIHEDSIKFGGGTKAPDYCFRIGSDKKFFVEAKRPSVNIKEEINPAYQLRRYAWSAKLPLSILTDFEELSVYDCRFEPKTTDKPTVGRIIYFTYKDYTERWDEIASIFSREAILKGSFDKYVESSKKKRGTAEVDDVFLKEIESWREMLAKDIAKHNPRLTQRELNFAVQRTIDRIIFLRICEDRGIEDYGRLMALQNGGQFYSRLGELYRQADEKYNSGLFHFHEEKNIAEPPDELTLRIKISDEPLKNIIKRLYYPDSPYEFSIISPDILGQVYEQFLGKVIKLISGHRAIVEEKPEVRKAGGIYYTPSYIVDYIVKNTVGKLLEGKNPKTASKLKILDPACGSGHFLIGTYQYLLDWHLDWYVKDGVKKWAIKKLPILNQDTRGNWRLTTSERKRILLNNIYGVDIDPQAVEVTKLSLLLKVLEGETQLRLFHERALPDLGNNIKCGNSLIGHDFYENQQISMFDEEERYRINAFDWDKEFKQIMESGGFDVVIGNPPWITMRGKERMDVPDAVVNYYLRKFSNSAEYKINSFALFIEKAIMLLGKKGRLGYIVPSTLLTNQYLSKIRKHLLDKTSIQEILDLGDKVFEEGVADSIIVITENTKRDNNPIKILTSIENLIGGQYIEKKVKQEYYLNEKDFVFNLSIELNERPVLQKIESRSISLGSIVKVYVGIVTGDNKKYLSKRKINQNYKKIIVGADLGRFYYKYAGNYVLFDKSKLWSNTDERVFLKPEKILLRKTGNQLIATIDTDKYFTEQTIYNIYLNDNIKYNLRYLLAIINSNLLQFYFSKKLITNPKAYPYIKGIHIEAIPIRNIDFNKPNDKANHDKIVKLVDNILSLNKQLLNASLPHEKNALEREIEATNRQIDLLVYDLYGLTEEEIMLVEGER